MWIAAGVIVVAASVALVVAVLGLSRERMGAGTTRRP